MSSTFLNGLDTFGINSISSDTNLILGGTNTNNIQLLNPIIANGDNNIILNNDTNIEGNTTFDGNVSVNGIVTNSSPVTLTNQLTSKSYVDSVLPTGTIIMRASLLNPPTGGTGYYLCDGSVKNTTTDSALFSIIQYTYGGTGSNFNLPNLLGRFPVGPTTSSSMQYLNTFTGGVTNGNVILNESNLPPHSHSATATTTSSMTHTPRQFLTNPQYNDYNGGAARNANRNAGIASSTDIQVNPNTITTLGPGPGTSAPFSIIPPYTVIAYYIKR
jgi:microcystin-dependent protein